MKFLSLIVMLCVGSATRAADPFAENVRTTDPLPPEEQIKTFGVPEGFEVQLVASEPDLQKPMNMAFDAQGRLWVSMSREYPFPAKVDEPGRDMIRVLEDFDEQGRARKITTFADGLNIPIGILPYKKGVIAWSIPNIWYYEDSDGDGKADRKEVLFGPLGWERDTHGNQASFRRGFDGWIYATHGYNNISHFRARDGSEMKVHSGNTYRFAPDASHIDQHTWGQVNPFGLCFDDAGNLYSADCHSAPIYELLRGGYYPSFGKPHDGLGYAPTLMEHSHGSTAIAGIVVYADDLWPEEYRNNIFIGNVMTSRINRDTLVPRGSSKTAREEKDFLTTTDPWFRPVDLQLGPDGALYIADFYNRIIGHYEVPLTHPGRDRDRARIWRVVYKGKKRELPNFAVKSAEDLIQEFNSPNLTRRLLALNELVDRFGKSAVPNLRKPSRPNSTAAGTVNVLWALQRLDGLEASDLSTHARHEDPLVRVHVMRILGEEEKLGATRKTVALEGLLDADANVRRAAAEALGLFPDAKSYVLPLLKALQGTPAEDDHLRHTIRIALRNQFRADGKALLELSFSEVEQQEVADICLAVETPEAAAFLARYLQNGGAKPGPERRGRIANYLRHAVRFIEPGELNALMGFIQSHYQQQLEEQLSFFNAIREGTAQRGGTLPEETQAWGRALAGRLIEAASGRSNAWKYLPLPEPKTSANPWFLQQRVSADGDKDSWFLCSLPPGGEQLTGVLRSPAFTVPTRLTFWIAGHDGIPSEPAQGNNLVRLVDSSGEVLALAVPPRNDTAQKIDWDLSESAGKKGFLELVDADTGGAYAWLAVGRFSPALLTLPESSPNLVARRVQSAAELARSLRAVELAPKLRRSLRGGELDLEAEAAVASALSALAPTDAGLALAPLLGDNSVPAPLRAKIRRAFAANLDAEYLLTQAMDEVSARVQVKLAQALASSATGAQKLLTLIEKGAASAQVLADNNVRDKIAAHQNKALQEQVTKLTADLESPDDAVNKLLEERRQKFNPARAQAVEGARVYLNNCSACHQIDGTGAVVGPHLDGIGSRGLERIIEDILDPNRNVDVHFRSQIVVLKDGEVMSGLFRREEGELLVLADSTGKELSIPKKEIESRRESTTSLMPSNFGDIMTEEDFNHLLAFLLSKGVPQSGAGN